MLRPPILGARVRVCVCTRVCAHVRAPAWVSLENAMPNTRRQA